MPNSTVVDEAQSLITKRIQELDAERSRLESALSELGGQSAPAPAKPRGGGKRGPGRPKGSAKASGPGKPKQRRRRRSGTRADEAVQLIEKSPGISASDVASAMNIKPNYLYRVLGDMEKEGRVKKEGRQYYPAS